MPAGFPGDPANAHQPPPFVTLDQIHSAAEGRWETLKLLRLLGWAWSSTAGWPPASANSSAAAFISGLSAGPTGLVYATILQTLRLSGVAEMRGLTDPATAQPPATTVAHIDKDWFSDLPKSPAHKVYPWLWKTSPVAGAATRERGFLKALMYALDRSLGLDSLPAFDHPDTWPQGASPAPNSWPPLQGSPNTSAAKLVAPIGAPLVQDKPIDHYWDNAGGSVFRFQTLVGASRVSFVVTTPAFNYP
jgi:hypothetical protein